MKLKATFEDNEHEVVYLQLKVGRDVSDNSIHMRWQIKEYSAKRILDFHSFHPMKTKDSVVKKFVRASLKISSDHHEKRVLRDVGVLRNSKYPNRYIKDKIIIVL